MAERETGATLSTDTLRRLSLSLIEAERAELIAEGQVPMALSPATGAIASGLNALRIDEDGFGFDSLARLRLILRFNRFFGLSATGIEDYLLVRPTFGDWVDLLGEHLKLVADGATFTFSTSGSSGPPRHITHGLPSLLAEVRSLAAMVRPPATQAERIIALVPPHHIYGFLFTCLLPEVLGCPVVDLHHSGPAAAFRHARAGDIVIGTPFNWDILQQTGQRFPEMVTGITSGAPATAATWAARDSIGLQRLVEIYGSTETAGIGWRDDGAGAFELLPHLSSRAQDVINPGREPACLPLQDHLDWRGPRQFVVKGRIDSVFQVGGVNVSPALVQDCLRQVAGVSDVAVRPHAGRIKAFVVPTDRNVVMPELESRLIAHARQSLAAPARPVSYTFGPMLPKNAMGKICDWQAQAPVGITET